MRHPQLLNTGTGIQKLSEKTDGSAEEKSVSISTNHTASPTSTGGWNDDEFTFRRNIDLYSELSINDKYRETVEPGEAFILTSDLDVCRISDILDKQIAKNEEIYGNIENAPLSNIEFAFTAEYDFDPDIDISNIHYDFFDDEGYDGPFQITDIERSAQSNHIQVTFGLDTEFSTVGDLKQAALDTGDYLKLNISGLKVSEDCGVKNTDLQIYGDVYRYLNADVAVNDQTTLHAIVNFSTWSSPRACVLVQETWNFNKSFNLDSWMSSSESSYGSVWTRYDQPFAITGHLDTSRIRRALESTASRSRAIHVVDVPPYHISDLTFTAVFTLPKGIEWTAEEALPELNNAEDFAIQNIEQDGKKITVTMGLADPESIDDVYDLYEIEQCTPEHLELTMGGFRVTEDNRYSGGSNTYTIYGRVSGTLEAEAETFGSIPYHIQLDFNGYEDSESNRNMKLEVHSAAPHKWEHEMDLAGSMNFDGKKQKNFAEDEAFGFSSILDVSSISELLDEKINLYQTWEDLSKVTLDNTVFTFASVYEFPEGMDLSQVTAELVGDTPFEVSAISYEGNELTVEFALKRDPESIDDLIEMQEQAGNQLELQIENIQAGESVPRGERLNITGSVSGYMETFVHFDSDWHTIRPMVSFTIPQEDQPNIAFRLIERQTVNADTKVPALLTAGTKQNGEILHAENGTGFDLIFQIDSNPVAASVEQTVQSGTYNDDIRDADLVYTAELSVPAGTHWNGNASSITLSDPEHFEVRSAALKNGKVCVTIGLKDADSLASLNELKDHLASLEQPLTATVSGYALNGDAQDGAIYSITSTVSGKLNAKVSGAANSQPYMIENTISSDPATAMVQCWRQKDYNSTIKLGITVGVNDTAPDAPQNVEGGTTITLRGRLSTEQIKAIVEIVLKDQGASGSTASLSQASLTFSACFTLPEGFGWNGSVPSVDGMKVTSFSKEGNTVRVDFGLDLASTPTLGELQKKVSALPATARVSLPGVTAAPASAVKKVTADFKVSGELKGEVETAEGKRASIQTQISDSAKQEFVLNPKKDEQKPDSEQKPAVKTITMHRLYNKNSGEHFYTASDREKNYLVSVGWNYEGEGWKAPETSSVPVFRLYNANAGDHHYTLSAKERDYLKSVGWKDEGIGWYSDEAQSVPLYRQYNPNAKAGSHNYTPNLKEHNILTANGWNDEGIAWHGVR